jgi:3-phenylpropionate/trans-cinnamate dioxygenase ferredoxin component
MTSFYPALPLSDLEDNRLHDVEIAGRQVLLVRIGAYIHAASNICPHAGSPLSLGWLAGDAVQCSLHGIRFRLSDGGIVGRAVCDPLEIYETRVRDGMVEVALPIP